MFTRQSDAEEIVDMENVYLHGTVGTGKSYLMDLFYDQVTIKKKRVHFHDFMLDVHKKLHHWRLYERQSKDEDPIPPIAEKLRAEASLLCFDEFQVTDVADAMILKRLFEQMFSRGMRFVVTSNRMPKELYKNGLNRPLFVPFITNILEKHFEVVDLSSDNDYRMSAVKASEQLYFWPQSNPKIYSQFLQYFGIRVGKSPLQAMSITAFGSRKITVPKCSADGSTCLYTFDELIRSAYGASDYLAIAKQFDTVFLEGIPKMQRDDCNLARRFITLIDVLYEHKCRVVFCAEERPDRLFISEAEAPQMEDKELTMADFTDSEWGSRRDVCGQSPDEVFAFNRSISRLAEMQSEAYLQEKHRKD